MRGERRYLPSRLLGRLLLPITRWLFDYSRENFRRQQRMNRILAAAIEEVAVENARLQREIAELKKRAVEP